MIRIFQSIILHPDSIIQLDDQATHHVVRVLRAKEGEILTVFNGQGGEYEGIITRIDKKNVSITLKKYISHNTESPLTLCLAQGISRGEKMDYTIQKAVELGVKTIIPLLTERCNVKLDKERSEKRLQHWRAIIIGACEQSGRNIIPDILAPLTLEDFLKDSTISYDWKFILAPTANQKLAQFPIQKTSRIILCVGPEGGFSEAEIQKATQHNFLSLNLGPRILRTETAAFTALTALQCHFGDLCE